MPEYSVDGEHGNETEDAVKAFQMKEGLAQEGKVNIRTGNDTSYARIASGKDGTSSVHVATAANCRYAIVVGSHVGWVSEKYSSII